ncbi:hypothetical protein P7K49_015271, partial [Saguinus oedipus]
WKPGCDSESPISFLDEEGDARPLQLRAWNQAGGKPFPHPDCRESPQQSQQGYAMQSALDNPAALLHRHRAL